MIRHVDKLDVSKVIADLNRDILHWYNNAAIVMGVRDNLSKFNGKDFSKRFETHLKSVMPGCLFHTDKGDFRKQATLYVWGCGVEYNNRIAFYFDKPETGTFKFQEFHKSQSDLLDHYVKNTDKAKAGIANAADLVAKWNAAVDAIEATGTILNDFGIRAGH